MPAAVLSRPVLPARGGQVDALEEVGPLEV